MFIEKLNKKSDGSVYVIEEEQQVIDGKYEGNLSHDNINGSTIKVYTGSKLTGNEIINVLLSIPKDTPWKTNIKLFASVDKVYISYETPGDIVEADDINQLQDEANTMREDFKQYSLENDTAVLNLKDRVANVETTKAAKTYVDIELAKKADKSTTYTKTETDQRIQAVINAAPEALDTLQEIANALNNDPGFAGTMTLQLAGKVDKVIGKGLSTEDYSSTEKTKLAGIETGANKYIHPGTGTNPHSTTKTDVGLGSVTNDAQVKRTELGAVNGVATLDSSGVNAQAPKSHNHDDRYYTEEEADNKFSTKDEISQSGYGDMLKSIYDIDNDGVVDNAKKVNGHSVDIDVPAGAKFTDTVYSHPTTTGNKHIPSGGASGQILRWSADGTATWGADNNTTYSKATTLVDGLMSKEDKIKLDKFTFPITWGQLKGV